MTCKGEILSENPTSSNNIYDLAGNVYDWTRGRNSDSGRKMRGGGFYNFGDGSTASYGMYGYSYSSDNDDGFRSMLFIR